MPRLVSVLTFVSLLFVLFVTPPALAQPRAIFPGMFSRPNMDNGKFEMVQGPGPRFVVTAYSFDAADETGWDWAGSDEVVTIIRTKNYTLVGPEYDDVDSEDPPVRYHDEDSCVIPPVDTDGDSNRRWHCDEHGVSAPISFSVVLTEQDFHLSMDFCSDNNIGTDVREATADVCEDYGLNDLIGYRTFNLSLADLIADLPEPGMSKSYKEIIGRGCTGACSRSYDGKYVFRYLVRRVDDAR